MRIEDNRLKEKSIMFKDLEVGRVFEHANLKMIMIKLDEVILAYDDGCYERRNALRIDDADTTLGGSSTSTEFWHISPESEVIPLNAKIVIEE